MAKSTSKSGSKSDSKTTTGTAVARKEGNGGRQSSQSDNGGMGDAFLKLLQSPLVAELMAVAATAALAALAEHGFNPADAGRGKRAGKAVKEAGKAAAAAIGRRLTNEFQEIRETAKAKNSAEA
jgi:hypothetical protein